MRRFLARCIPVVVALFCSAPVQATDHDNLDSGRPLHIEDAESIAFREQDFEFGLSPSLPFRPSRGAVGIGLSAEYLYGFALNTHLSLDFDPSLGARSQTGDGRLDMGNVGVGVFRTLNRETLFRPALAVRADLYLPTGRGTRGIALRLRGIASRTFARYSRIHINADATVRTDAPYGARAFLPALTVGIGRPVGYPTRFDRTVVAELGARASDEQGKGAVFSAGVGLRQQATVRSVVDVGLTTDFAATSPVASRDRLRVVVGYSTQF